MKTHTINKFKVQKIPKDHVPEEFIKGYELFPEVYANVYILAKKNSGKTTVEFNILKKCANTNTTVVFFAGQIYKDGSYKTIINWLKKKNIPYVLNNSLMDDEGQNQLRELLVYLRNEYKGEFEENESESIEVQQPILSLHPDSDSEDEEKEDLPNSQRKPSKNRKLAPDYIFVFDDISEEIKGSVQIASLLKTNRHYKSKVIICSQFLNDVRPDVIGNLDYLLLFKKVPMKKLEEVWSKLNLDISLDTLKSIYAQATEKQYNFLYIDIRNEEYRKNFNELIVLPKI